jgi:hypothetical protein
MSNAAGAIISCVASVIGNVGIQVQKGAHKALEAKPEAERTHYIYDFRWWLGLSGVIFGAIGDFIALGLAEQALVTAVGGATTLTTNVLLSKFYNHEKIYNLDLAGVLLIILGAIIIAALVPSEAEEQTLVTLLAYSTAPSFCLYMFTLSVTVVCLLASVADSYMYRMRSKATGGVLVPITRRLRKLEEGEEFRSSRERELEVRLQEMEMYVGKLCQYLHDKQSRERANARRCGYAPEEMDTPLLELGNTPSQGMDARVRRDSFIRELDEVETQQKQEQDYRHWKDAYIYAACSGAIGSVSVLLGGLTSKCLMMAFAGNNEWDEAYPYLFLCGMLTTVILQTKYLNSALELADVMTVFPTFQAVWIAFGVMGGIIFYQQADMGAGVWIGITIAAVLMVVGCVFLMLHGKKEFQEKLAKKMEDMVADTRVKVEGGRKRLSAMGMSQMLAIGRSSAGVDHEGNRTHSRTRSRDGAGSQDDPNAETPLSESESGSARDDDSEYDGRISISEKRRRRRRESMKGRGKRSSKHRVDYDIDSEDGNSSSGISVWQRPVKQPERLDIQVHRRHPDGSEERRYNTGSEDGRYTDSSASDTPQRGLPRAGSQRAGSHREHPADRSRYHGSSYHGSSYHGRPQADSSDSADMPQSMPQTMPQTMPQSMQSHVDMAQLDIMETGNDHKDIKANGPAPPSNTCASTPSPNNFQSPTADQSDPPPSPVHANSTPAGSFSSKIFGSMRGGRLSPPDAIAVHPSFSPAAAAKPPMQHDELDIGLDRTTGEQTRQGLQAELAKYDPKLTSKTKPFRHGSKTGSSRDEQPSAQEMRISEAQPVPASHVRSQLEAQLEAHARPEEEGSSNGHVRSSSGGAVPVTGVSAGLSLHAVGTHTYEPTNDEKENNKTGPNPAKELFNPQLLLEKPVNLRSQSDNTIRTTNVFDGKPVSAASTLPRQSSKLVRGIPVEDEPGRTGHSGTPRSKQESVPNLHSVAANPFEIPEPSFGGVGDAAGGVVDNNPFDVYSSRGSPLSSINPQAAAPAYQGALSANPSFGSTAVPYFASPSPKEGVVESATMEFRSAPKGTKGRGSKGGGSKGGGSKGGGSKSEGRGGKQGKVQRRRTKSKEPAARRPEPLAAGKSLFDLQDDSPVSDELVSPFKVPPMPPSGASNTSPGRMLTQQLKTEGAET